MEHLVSTLKGFVDPLRSLRLDGVVNLVGAQVPGLDFLRNVEVSLHSLVVEVGNERSSPGAGREFIRCSSSL
jgi:hypothetical protein